MNQPTNQPTNWQTSDPANQPAKTRKAAVNQKYLKLSKCTSLHSITACNDSQCLSSLEVSDVAEF